LSFLHDLYQLIAGQIYFGSIFCFGSLSGQISFGTSSL
jgi:hypothetical protein